MTANLGKLLSHFENFKNSSRALINRKSFKYGVPFLLFVVGGSFGLREWTEIRYQFSNVKGVTREEAKQMGLDKERDVTLEDVYDEIQKLDIDNWENKRGPRPWELQEEQKKK